MAYYGFYILIIGFIGYVIYYEVFLYRQHSMLFTGRGNIWFVYLSDWASNLKSILIGCNKDPEKILSLYYNLDIVVRGHQFESYDKIFSLSRYHNAFVALLHQGGLILAFIYFITVTRLAIIVQYHRYFVSSHIISTSILLLYGNTFMSLHVASMMFFIVLIFTYKVAKDR